VVVALSSRSYHGRPGSSWGSSANELSSGAIGGVLIQCRNGRVAPDPAGQKDRGRQGPGYF